MTDLQLQYLITTGVPTIAILIVGLILANQIRSQKTLLSKYKEYIEAVNPEKIIALHKREVEQLEATLTNDIKTLRGQVIQMAYYIDHDISHLEQMASTLDDPDIFNRDSHINRNLSDCAGILQKVREIRQSKIPSA